MWEERAKEVEEVYGGYVDWKYRYYECPECGAHVYECNWTDSLKSFICPICGFEGKDKDFEVTISVTYTVSAKTPEQAKEFASEMFINNINCSNFDVDIIE